MATRRRRRKSQAMRDDAQDDLYGNDGDRARGSGSESEVDSDNDGDDDGESTLTGPGESLTGGACVEIQISELIGAQMGKSKEPVSQDWGNRSDQSSNADHTIGNSRSRCSS